MDSLIFSLRNLGRKRMRSFLTILSIAIGVSSVVIIGSIGQIGKATINQELGSLGLGSLSISADAKFTNQKMDETDLALLRDLPIVQSATPVVMEYSNARMRGLIANTVFWGVDGSKNPLISLKSEHGRLLNSMDSAGASNVCVVDKNMAKMFYNRDNIVGKQLEAMIGGRYVTLEIVGVVSSGGNLLQSLVGDMIPSFVYVPYTTIQRYTQDTSFEQIAVTLNDNVDTESASKQIVNTVNHRHNLTRGFKTEDIARQKETLNKIMELVTQILSAIAAVSLMVAGLGVMTVMIVSVHERTREIGIKKSIGASKGRILVEFILESLVLSILGSLAGLGTGLGVIIIGCSVFSLELTLDVPLILSCLFLSVIVGALFGAYPAALAARMRPVDALRTDY